MTDVATAGPVSVGPNDLEQHRVELTAYCYRMLGSAFEAEDAVQDTLVRAWRGLDRFEGRSALRSWLYRIATNVCFDMLKGRQRRARPMDLGPARSADAPVGPTLPEDTWVEPIPDGRVLPDGRRPGRRGRRPGHRPAGVRGRPAAPAAAAAGRADPARGAALAGQPRSPSCSTPRSRRSTARCSGPGRRSRARRPARRTRRSGRREQQALLDRYVDAFERYDMDALTALLHEDATQSMPPYAMWLRGREDILRLWLGPGAGCRGSRLVPTAANGSPAFAQYKPSGPGGAHRAVGAAGPADLRRPHRRAHVLPVHRRRCSPSSGFPRTPPSPSSPHHLRLRGRPGGRAGRAAAPPHHRDEERRGRRSSRSRGGR